MEHLPSEILIKILCYCEVKDILNIGASSKSMKTFTEYNYLWKVLFYRDYISDGEKIYDCPCFKIDADNYKMGLTIFYGVEYRKDYIISKSIDKIIRYNNKI